MGSRFWGDMERILVQKWRKRIAEHLTISCLHKKTELKSRFFLLVLHLGDISMTLHVGVMGPLSFLFLKGGGMSQQFLYFQSPTDSVVLF